jgi:hypothetical protein
MSFIGFVAWIWIQDHILHYISVNYDEADSKGEKDKHILG